jgi:hypothetical protein
MRLSSILLARVYGHAAAVGARHHRSTTSGADRTRDLKARQDPMSIRMRWSALERMGAALRARNIFVLTADITA